MTTQQDTLERKGTVVAFDLPERVLADLHTAVRGLRAEVHETDMPTDILAVGACLSVCDFSRMERKRLEEVLGWFTAMSADDRYFRIMFTAPLPVRIHRTLSKSVIRTPEVIDPESLKLTILNVMTAAKRRERNDKKHDTKLRRLFYILRNLRENKVAYSRDLCSDLNVTPRTIERDINILIDMGELIAYDRSAKRYKLVDSVSDI